MLPSIWIFDTYSIMLFIGLALCLFVFYKYGIKKGLEKKYIYDVLIMSCIVIALGILSAFLFQKIFDALKQNSTNGFGSMTFFGGLAGGVIFFILGYKFYIKKRYPKANFLNDIAIIAPACIAIAHSMGRIGCFFAGCCYGIETNSIFGIRFPGMNYNVYPTQLFEALFLLILFILLFYLAYFKSNKYSLSIYAISYGTFRFLIEFIRGDDRGVFVLGFSPSQIFSIICIISGIVFIVLIKKNFFNSKEEKENV